MCDPRDEGLLEITLGVSSRRGVSEPDRGGRGNGLLSVFALREEYRDVGVEIAGEPLREGARSEPLLGA